jgi:hypothetical protein
MKLDNDLGNLVNLGLTNFLTSENNEFEMWKSLCLEQKHVTKLANYFFC